MYDLHPARSVVMTLALTDLLNINELCVKGDTPISDLRTKRRQISNRLLEIFVSDICNLRRIPLTLGNRIRLTFMHTLLGIL